VLGAVSGVEDVDIFANRFCSSLSCRPLPVVAGGDDGAIAEEFEAWRAGGGGAIPRWRGGTGGEALRPMPKPGTDTPA
jgi:hypothetical protein